MWKGFSRKLENVYRKSFEKMILEKFLRRCEKDKFSFSPTLNISLHKAHNGPIYIKQRRHVK